MNRKADIIAPNSSSSDVFLSTSRGDFGLTVRKRRLGEIQRGERIENWVEGAATVGGSWESRECETGDEVESGV